MKQLEREVFEVILPFADELNLEIYDVIYEKRGKDMYLTIYIHKENGISIDDCENLNNLIENEIDEKIKIDEQYFLEVSSSGLERHIRNEEHFKKYLNTQIEIHLFKPVDKIKVYTGLLKKYTDNTVTILADDKEYLFEKADISQIRTVYDWNNEKGGDF